ncbi:MAG: sensor histidine kinase [Micromonosporaceae bacterium]
MATAAQRDTDDTGRRVWQHALFYSWLVLATVWPLSDRLQDGRSILLPLVLTAALALWYAVWLVIGPPPSQRSLWVYLAGAGLLWLGLLVIDDSFLLVGLNVFAPYCLQTLRVGLVAIGLFAGGWFWQRLAAEGAVTWQDVVITALIALCGAAMVGYVSSLSRTSAERKRLLDQLRTAQDARAAAERQAGAAAERQRLARDIHDTLTQSLASIVMLLEAAEASAADGAGRHVTRALRVARDSLVESRRVVWALPPGQLDDGELPEALAQLVTRLSEETGIRGDTVLTGSVRPLGPRTQTALLRVGQEALSNARRHANASRVSVTLSYMEDVVALDVQDDGTGFDARRTGLNGGTATGVGMRSMRERVEELGGALVVESAHGEGTTVAATVPAEPANDAATDPTSRDPRDAAGGAGDA